MDVLQLEYLVVALQFRNLTLDLRNLHALLDGDGPVAHLWRRTDRLPQRTANALVNHRAVLQHLGGIAARDVTLALAGDLL